MKPIYLIIAIACCAFASCRKCEDEKLTIALAPYTDSALRIDGYYYYLSEENLNKYGDTLYHILVPYSGGQTLETSTHSFSKLEDGFTKGWYERRKGGWGAFKIEGNSMIVEYWTIGFGQRCWNLNSYSCTIWNDSTFIMDTETADGKTVGNGHVYHFKVCSIKPSPDPKFYN